LAITHVDEWAGKGGVRIKLVWGSNLKFKNTISIFIFTKENLIS
jgi:hypothetical protein